MADWDNSEIIVIMNKIIIFTADKGCSRIPIAIGTGGLEHYSQMKKMTGC
jgi:hypothetical protein